MGRKKLWEGRLLWPNRRQYKVTTWWSDGSMSDSWEPALDIPPPPGPLWGLESKVRRKVPLKVKPLTHTAFQIMKLLVASVILPLVLIALSPVAFFYMMYLAITTLKRAAIDREFLVP